MVNVSDVFYGVVLSVKQGRDKGLQRLIAGIIVADLKIYTWGEAERIDALKRLNSDGSI